jgi:AraC-like DNA-binding protein
MKKRNPDAASLPVVGLAERYAAGSVAPHKHARTQLMYAVRGGMTVLTNSGSWVLPPHRALWVPGGLEHGLKVGTSIELRTLYIAPKSKGMPDWQACQVVEVPPLIRELILKVVDFGWDYASHGADARLVQVLLERLLTVRQQPVHLPEPTDDRARRFAAHMYANLTDRRPLAVIAKEIGASLRSLERVFTEDTGVSVGAWVQQMRLVFALEMLADGQRVGDVAFQVGYENPSSFIAVFRRTFGTTPTAYFVAG